MTKPFQ